MVNRIPSSTNKKKKIVRFLVILFVTFLSFQFYQNYKTLDLMRQEVNELEKQIQYVSYEKSRLLTQLSQINSPEYIEQIAREKLGYVKEGEILIILKLSN